MLAVMEPSRIAESKRHSVGHGHGEYFERHHLNRNESKWIEIPQTDPWEWHFLFYTARTLKHLLILSYTNLYLLPLELVLHLMGMFVSYDKDYAWQKLQREEWSVMAHWSLQDRKIPIFLLIAMPSFSGGCQEPPRSSKDFQEPESSMTLDSLDPLPMHPCHGCDRLQHLPL